MVQTFIIECRGQGVQLPYSDLQIISDWIKAAPNPDLLLLTLSELVPEYYEAKAERRIPPSLKGLDRKVTRRLSDLSRRHLSGFAAAPDDCTEL